MYFYFAFQAYESSTHFNHAKQVNSRVGTFKKKWGL